LTAEVVYLCKDGKKRKKEEKRDEKMTENRHEKRAVFP
jgi:hypothetical protein